jgi:hypothetical protein
LGGAAIGEGGVQLVGQAAADLDEPATALEHLAAEHADVFAARDRSVIGDSQHRTSSSSLRTHVRIL